MTKVKALPKADKAALIVRSKMGRAKKEAAVRSATSRVRTSATVDFVRSVRGR
jgi:hypothetical protein